MTLSNATLSAITAPAAADKFGDRVVPAPATISVRCVLADVKQSQRIAMGATIQGATAVLYVLKANLGNLKPARGSEIRVTIDGGQLQILDAEHVVDHEKSGGLSHYQVFLKERR